MEKDKKIRMLAKVLNLPFKDAKLRLEAYYDVLAEGLVKSESIKVSEIGVVNVKERAATVFNLKGTPMPSDKKKKLNIIPNKKLQAMMMEKDNNGDVKC